MSELIANAHSFWLAMGLIAVIGYFCGSFNGAVIVSKYILRDDIRNHGSGNAGLTNFFRTFGGVLTFVVILTDVIKAVVALMVAMALMGQMVGDAAILMTLAKYWGGLLCLIGHMFPFMFHFRGGKGILSGGTIAIMIDWRLAVVVWGGFLILALITRWVSLGSVFAGVTFPIATYFIYQEPVISALGLIIGTLLVWKHRANIGRLLKGTESKLSFSKGKKAT